MLIHHTDCGMLTFTDQEFRDSIAADTGVRPSWASEAFNDLEGDIRQSINRILAEPSIPLKDSVRGFVYDVKSGQLNEVSPS